MVQLHAPGTVATDKPSPSLLVLLPGFFLPERVAGVLLLAVLWCEGAHGERHKMHSHHEDKSWSSRISGKVGKA